MTENAKKYRGIGLMSGTSLDGLDVACCEFRFTGHWSFELLAYSTITYPADFQSKLQECINYNQNQLNILDMELGEFIGQSVNEFLSEHQLTIDYIASHGHTVFHQPDEGITLQIGSGQKIKEICNTTVIYDFRSQDVLLGGQGAPLVPIGDRHLFPEYTSCVNLGGIANLSFESDQGKRRAYDICGCNLILNQLSMSKGKQYDDGGRIASAGTMHPNLLEALIKNPYLQKPGPKSLGKEDLWRSDIEELKKWPISTEDKLRTYVEYVAMAIGESHRSMQGKILFTGGGVYNSFLMSRIQKHLPCGCTGIVPPDEIIAYKEALIFAFLGCLKLRGETNVLSSVTGASRDSSSGVVL